MLDYKNYVTDSDTGFNDLDSIRPVTDNETADQTTFRRPPENLRYRSEQVRKAFEELEAVVSSDRGLVVACGPDVQVTWDGVAPGGDGTFAITGGDLRLVPITNPAAPTANNSVFNKLEVKRFPARFLAYSRARINEGGNNLQLEIFHVVGVFFSGNAVNVTVEGSKNDAGDFDPLAGPVVVRVQLSHNGSALTSTWTQVAAGINGMPPPLWITAEVNGPGAATVATDVDRQYLWAGTGVDDVFGTAGCDAQTYRVTAHEFADFFADHSLGEGDALVLDFGSAAARLDQAGDVTLGSHGSGILQIIHRDGTADLSYAGHANMMNAVPICKVVGDVLYFINGAAFPVDAPGSLGLDTGLRAELIDDGGTSAGVLPNGAKLVASDVQQGSHTPHNFNVDNDRTVFKQLGVLLDWMNGHFNAAADKHPLKDITARPFKTVGASGCDYTTIGAALTALCTGGVILVTAGTYTSGQWDSTGYPVSGPVDVIGMGSVVWAPSTTAPIVKLVSGQAISAPLRFHNITFDRGGVAEHTVELLCNSNLTYGTVEFYGCKFTRSNVSAAYVHIRAMGAARLVVDHCDFTRAVQISDTTHIYIEGTPNVSITNSHFTYGANVVIAAAATAMFTFEHNEVYSCGQVVVGDPTAILDLSVASQINVSIKNNNFSFKFGTATPSKEWGRMVDVQAATGEISGNFYENADARYWTGEVPTTRKYAITATGLNENRRLNVTGNNLDPGPCCGVRANNAMVLDNTIRNFYPRNSGESMYAIYLLGAKVHCRGNNINCAADSPANGGIFAYRCQKANISGNQIYGTLLEGITLEDGNYCSITNNDIVGIQGGFGHGIFLATGGADTNIHNTVHGNRLNSAEGIWVEGTFHIISNNTVRIGSSLSAGITMTDVAGKYCVVQGNILFMNSSGTGVHCAQELTTITGNLIYVAAVGILIEQALCTITGNTLHQCQMGIGLYAATCTKFTCTGNTLYVPDVDGSMGITCNRAGPTPTKLYGSITGNTIYRSGNSNSDGSFGIDLRFCDYVGCSGNTLGPYEYFAFPINTEDAAGVGLGRNLDAPNTHIHNLFDEAI